MICECVPQYYAGKSQIYIRVCQVNSKFASTDHNVGMQVSRDQICAYSAYGQGLKIHTPKTNIAHFSKRYRYTVENKCYLCIGAYVW